MQMAAFLTSPPLHRRSHHRAVSDSSVSYTRVVCVAKPPPRTSQSDEPKPVKEEEGKDIPFSDPAYPAKQKITSAELSQRLSRAVGLNLFFEDIASLSGFLKSFLRPKSPNRTEQRGDDGSDPGSATETNLIVPDNSPVYKPKSVTATNIATAYTIARGVVDRALQTLYIQGQSYINEATQIAGDSFCKLLSAGHQVLPGLQLNRARDAVAGVLKDGWVPLDVFQWQLLAGLDDNLEQRREERVQQISKFFSGVTLGGFVNAAGATLSTVGKTAERMAPVMFRGVTTASFGKGRLVTLSKQSKPSVHDNQTIFQRVKQETERLENVSSRNQDQPILKSKVGSDVITFAKTSAAFRKGRVRQSSSENQAEARYPVSSVSSDGVLPSDESDDSVDQDSIEAKTTASTRDGSAKVKTTSSTRTLRGGAIIVAAGAVAGATAIVSAPTAITCSTLMIAAMALSGAKRANAADLEIQAQHHRRQSRTLQHAERVLMKSTSFPRGDAQFQRFLSPGDPQKTRRDKDSPTRFTVTSPAGTSRTGRVNSDAIDASSYAVSPPQPFLMSLPIIGVVLHWLDGGAFHMERLIGTVLRRSGVRHIFKSQKAEWELLWSFQDGSKPG